jgi:hypothetical protein
MPAPMRATRCRCRPECAHDELVTPTMATTPPLTGWRRRLRDITTERLGLNAIALVFALLLWIVVSARQPTEGYVGVRVAPTLDSSLTLIGSPPEVQVLVSGRAADLVKLYATPLVLRRTISGDVPDTLMLDVSAADVHVPAELSEAVHVLDVQPRVVMLRFAKVRNRASVDGAARSGGAPSSPHTP